MNESARIRVQLWYSYHRAPLISNIRYEINRFMNLTRWIGKSFKTTDENPATTNGVKPVNPSIW